MALARNVPCRASELSSRFLLEGANIKRTASLVVLPLALIVAGPSRAQSAGRWEFGLFGGGSFGTRIFLDPSSDVRIGRSFTYGLRGAYEVSRSFSLEAAFSRTRGKLDTLDAVSGEPRTPSARIDITTYELDSLFGFGRGAARGYLGLGAGAMTLHPDVGGVANEVQTRFSANIALGGKLALGENVVLRADARYRFRESSRSALVCGPAGCYGFSTGLTSSAEITGGLSYRFGNVAPDGTREAAPAVPPTTAADWPASKRFWAAAGELALVELVPWAFDRYVTREDFAVISLHSVRENFRNGFGFDRDVFRTNQAAHPYHGGLYFNAARSNGFTFWQSAGFALVGSFVWECCMENTRPSINDLVNTTLGGMALGEITHRVAVMIRDNTASGANRFWRELAGGVVDPVGGLNRLLRGETTGASPNPDERFPKGFRAAGDVGYRKFNNGPSDANAFTVSLSAASGDPFAGDIRKPFDSFSVEIDLNSSRDVIARVEGRGALKAGELSDPAARVRHVLGLYQEYEYFSNESQVFGAQSLSLGLTSRYVFQPKIVATSDVRLVAYPLAGIQTTDFADPATGRTYDFAPGAGVRVGGRLDLEAGGGAFANYTIAWARTVDGSSDRNTLQFFNVGLRLPVIRSFGIGAGYAWYSRKTTYTGFFEARKTQSEWRVFASFKL